MNPDIAPLIVSNTPMIIVKGKNKFFSNLRKGLAAFATPPTAFAEPTKKLDIVPRIGNFVTNAPTPFNPLAIPLSGLNILLI